MANLNTDRIKAAQAIGCFSCLPLTDARRLCFHSSVVTCADILSVIQDRGDDGADLDQLAHDTGSHKNTVAQYCRVLVELGLIEVQIYEFDSKKGRPQNVYFESG